MMGITQISKIQVTRGAAIDLPKGTVETPTGLDEGEFGLTVDNGELFIGTPNLQSVQHRKPTPEQPTGSYPYANTRVLTEWSNNAGIIRYALNDGSGSNLPTDENGTVIYRSLQVRLDDQVSVKDYGAKGDGATDDTFAIWAAMVECSKTLAVDGKVYQPRTVYFPSGIYRVTRPILLPPNASMVGDCKNNTVILLDPDSVSTAINCVVETVDDGLSIDDLVETWNSEAVAKPLRTEYAIGTNIPNTTINGALPSNITVSNITFKVNSQTNVDVVHLNRAHKTTWTNCAFIGSALSTKDPVQYSVSGSRVSSTHTPTSDYNYATDTIGVFIDGLGDMINPHDHVFNGCSFNSTTYGVSISDQVSDCVFDGCVFQQLGRGISLGEVIPTNTRGLHTVVDPSTVQSGINPGPVGILVTRSIFKDIAGEALYGNRVEGITSSNNMYHSTIGKGEFNTSTYTPVIAYEQYAFGCKSICDWFEREDTSLSINSRLVVLDQSHNYLVGSGVSYSETTTLNSTMPTETGIFILVSPAQLWHNYAYTVSDQNDILAFGTMTLTVKYDTQNPLNSICSLSITDVDNIPAILSANIVLRNGRYYARLMCAGAYPASTLEVQRQLR